jgi:outer membrane protein assembly factor BamD (BamD/ComL family)
MVIYRTLPRVILILLIVFVAASCKKKSEAELQTIAQNYEKEEKFTDAFKTYEKLIKSYPKSPNVEETLLRMAFISYNNLNDFAKAIELHKRLIQDYPESKFAVQSRFMIGYIYANDLKDYDNARTSYTEFLEKHPDSELVESVKWELEHLGKDINLQLQELFSNQKADGRAKMN